MTTVPKLDRLTPADTGNFRFAGIWKRVCDKIEAAFTDIIASQVTIAAVQTALDGKNSIFRATSAPTATATGDLWLDSDDGDKPYRWSGSAWVAVQDIGAAYARLGLNSDGTVGTDNVLTDSILAEAVTTKAYAFTAGSVNIASGSYTYAEVQSVTITTSGEDVEIDGYFENYVNDNCKYQYRILRDGSSLIDLGPITVNTNDGPPAFFRYVDSPAAGTYEYTVEVACNDATDLDVLNRGLSAKEIKR